VDLAGEVAQVSSRRSDFLGERFHGSRTRGQWRGGTRGAGFEPVGSGPFRFSNSKRVLYYELSGNTSTNFGILS